MVSRSLCICLLSGTTMLNGCGYFAARNLSGEEVPAPKDFSFVGERDPCYLELNEGQKGLRMNCFQINGDLHIHSSRWARLPRLSGESWTVTVRRQPAVRIELADKIYSMRAEPLDDENTRLKILDNRGYWYAWDGIQVFRFEPVEGNDQ